MNKFSFIITSYKNTDNLKRCIESIEKLCINHQYEIILALKLDNELVDLYLNTYKNLQFVSGIENNVNESMVYKVSKNRLKALLVAKGDFIIFLDANDYYTNFEFLNQAMHALNNKKIIGCAFNFIYMGKNILGEFGYVKHSATQYLITGKINSRAYMQRYYFPTGAIVFKNFFKNINIDKLKHMEYFDNDLIVLFALNYGKLYYINQQVLNYCNVDLYTYCYSESGITRSYYENDMKQYILNINMYSIAKLNGLKLCKELLFRYYTSFLFFKKIYKGINTLDVDDDKELNCLLSENKQLCNSFINDLVYYKTLGWYKKLKIKLFYRLFKIYVNDAINSPNRVFNNKDRFSYLIHRKYFNIFRKKQKYIIAARPDATGMRLCSMLNAMYMADKLNINFAFMWDSARTCLSVHSDTNYNDDCTAIESPYEIFDKGFIDKYMIKNPYLDIYDDGRSYGTSHIKANGIFELLKNRSPNWWGWYAEAKNIWDFYDGCNKKDIIKGLSKAYKQITFSQNYQQIIDDAYHEFKQLDQQFIAIHIRTGEAVYSHNIKIILKNIAGWRIFSYELVIDIILKNQDKYIVIFGDDFESNKKLVQYFNNDRIVDISTIAQKYNYSYAQRLFFDLNFISFASNLYKLEDSGFSRFSHFISNGNMEIKTLEELYSIKDRYEIIKQNFSCLDLHPFQKAASCLALYGLAKKLKYSSSILIQYLKQALFYDNENYGAILSLTMEYIKNSEMEQAEELLKNIKEQDYNGIVSILNGKGDFQGFEEEKESIMYFEDINFPTIIKIKQCLIRYDNFTK